MYNFNVHYIYQRSGDGPPQEVKGRPEMTTTQQLFNRDDAHAAADWLADKLVQQMTKIGFDVEIRYNPGYEKYISYSTNRNGDLSAYFNMTGQRGEKEYIWSFRVSDHSSRWAPEICVYAPLADEFLELFINKYDKK